MRLFKKHFNPKLWTIKTMAQMKFPGMSRAERIAFANLGTTRVSDLVLACDLDLSVHQLLDMAEDYKSVGKTYLVRFGKRWVTIMTPGNGPASWEIGLTALVEAGARKIIQIGVCGSLSPEIKIGDLVVAESVFINDDTSRAHSDKHILECRGDMYTFVKSAVPKLLPKDVRWHACRVVSAPTLFGQTRAMLDDWSQLGQAVDLETGVLFALCTGRNVDFLAVYMVVDDKRNDLDIFTMSAFPIGKIFDNSDHFLRGLVQGIKDYNLGKPEHGQPQG